MGQRASPCDGETSDAWEARVAEALSKSKWYQRNQGADHLFFWMKYNQVKCRFIPTPNLRSRYFNRDVELGTAQPAPYVLRAPTCSALHPTREHYTWHLSLTTFCRQVAAAPLQSLLNGGSLIATTDRYFWNVYRHIPKPFVRGNIVIMPYLDSSYIDIPGSDPKPHAKKSTSRYFFRGILQRRFGMRSTLNDLRKVGMPLTAIDAVWLGSCGWYGGRFPPLLKKEY